jgi:hypothetical protein
MVTIFAVTNPQEKKEEKMIHKEGDDGFNPIEGETVAAMIARLEADPAVMAIYNERQKGTNKSGEPLPTKNILTKPRDT